MKNQASHNETIVAIATPPGRGGVGILRLSGDKACIIAKQISRISIVKPRVAQYQSFYQEDELIDQGILLFFKAPHSFTGEDVVELQLHGSPIILDRLVKICIQKGARLARPGEFSERAFLNHKIDLAQAEAIADLIQAHSLTAARMAMRSLQGEFSKKIDQLNQQIIKLRLFVEAAIDFPEEEVDFLSEGNIANQLQEIISNLDTIRKAAQQGAIMREGISIVITGRPNAGKSTLINQLAGRDVAIVTDVPGTTRDVMREHILLDDIPLHIIDTAGLHESDDIVEKEGIKRAWAELMQADCVLLVIDENHPEGLSALDKEIQAQLPPHVPVIRLYNKIDKSGGCSRQEGDTIHLSAKSGDGLGLLKEKIKEVVGYQPSEGQFMARRRHLQALDKAHDYLSVGLQQLTHHRAGELLAEDLRLSHITLCEITGEFTPDDLLGEIFSSFCIGK